MRSTALLALLLPTAALAACSHDLKPEPAHPVLVRKHLERRQREAASSASSTTRRTHHSSSAAAAAPAAAAPTAAAPAAPAAPAPAAGAVNPFVDGSPPLPNWQNIVIGDFPELDRIPDVNSAKVRGWVAEVNAKRNIPKIPVTGLDGCSNSTYNAQALKDAGANANCWWTCGGCERDTDIVSCPQKNTWGMSFDDGPSEDTPRLLQYLKNNGDLKSTFFIVGSRALSRPEILQQTYMTGHEISVHTWSHNSLTTLTDEEIIAELGWSKEVIKAVIGVTPTTMRPPYGDIDDRVRAVAMAMDLTPIIWTSVGEQTFDTQDWRLGDPASHMTQADVMKNFNTFLELSKGLSTGFIVLAHDLYAQSVDLAIQSILPGAMAFTPKLTLQPINTCQGKPMSSAYIETAGASVTNSSSASSISSAASSATSSASGSAASSSSRAPGGSAVQAEVSARPTSSAGSLKVGAGVLAAMVAGVVLL